MKTVSTFSVILILRPIKNKINEGLIYARISVNGEQREISLKEKVLISQWNADKQQVEGRTPQKKALNTHLDNVHSLRSKKSTGGSLIKSCRSQPRGSKMHT